MIFRYYIYLLYVRCVCEPYISVWQNSLTLQNSKEKLNFCVCSPKCSHCITAWLRLCNASKQTENLVLSFPAGMCRFVCMKEQETCDIETHFLFVLAKIKRAERLITSSLQNVSLYTFCPLSLYVIFFSKTCPTQTWKMLVSWYPGSLCFTPLPLHPIYQ